MVCILFEIQHCDFINISMERILKNTLLLNNTLNSKEHTGFTYRIIFPMFLEFSRKGLLSPLPYS